VHATRNMSRRRKEHMINMPERWSMDP